MEPQPQDVQGAIRDLAAIRRAIEQADADSWGGRLLGTTSIHLILHYGLAVIVTLLIIAETVVRPSITERYLHAFHTQDVGILAVVQIAIVLLLLVALFYFVVWYQAKRSKETFEQYSSRHFAYLRNLSFLSDLFVKFSAISLVILAMRPDWVAPLLFVCTGDYLIQGRIFVLPVRASLCLGLFCLAAGVIQCIYFRGTLTYPLFTFLLITVLSLVQITILRRQDKQESTLTAE